MLDIFELLEKNFNIYKQVNDLSKMICIEKFFHYYNDYYTFMQIFDFEYIRKWDIACGRIEMRDILEEIGIRNEDELLNINDEKTAIYLLQLYFNMLAFVDYCKYNTYNFNNDDCNMLRRKCNYIIDTAGMHVVEHVNKDYYLIVPRNEKINMVADRVEEDSVMLMSEYTSVLLKGDCNRKLQILKLLANEVEGPLKHKKHQCNQELFSKLGELLNKANIRHDNSLNKNGKALSNYSEVEKEELYDLIFELMLDVLILDNYSSNLKSIIKKHEDKLGINKKGEDK